MLSSSWFLIKAHRSPPPTAIRPSLPPASGIDSIWQRGQGRVVPPPTMPWSDRRAHPVGIRVGEPTQLT